MTCKRADVYLSIKVSRVTAPKNDDNVCEEELRAV